MKTSTVSRVGWLQFEVCRSACQLLWISIKIITKISSHTSWNWSNLKPATAIMIKEKMDKVLKEYFFTFFTIFFLQSEELRRLFNNFFQFNLRSMKVGNADLFILAPNTSLMSPQLAKLEEKSLKHTARRCIHPQRLIYATNYPYPRHYVVATRKVGISLYRYKLHIEREVDQWISMQWRFLRKSAGWALFLENILSNNTNNCFRNNYHFIMKNNRMLIL